MRILVTGATGFVGSNLLPVLAEAHDVFALARTAPSDAAPGVTWFEQDLAQPLTGLPEQIDAVIHLAQSRRYREWPDGAPDMFAVNVESTFRLLDFAQAAGARAFLHASTGGVYGGSPRPVTESDPIDVSAGFYPASKWSAEALVAGYQSAFVTVVFRFFFVYGPGQTGMLMPSLIEKVRAGEELTVQGAEGLRINPIHVADAVRVFEPALALTEHGVFNIAGDETISISELIGLIEQEVGHSAVVTSTDGSPTDLVAANQKMKDVLGVTPRISLAEGIRSML
jgi:nucleoside-diphosphate-sugar epimerase